MTAVSGSETETELLSQRTRSCDGNSRVLRSSIHATCVAMFVSQMPGSRRSRGDGKPSPVERCLLLLRQTARRGRAYWSVSSMLLRSLPVRASFAWSRLGWSSGQRFLGTRLVT